MRSTNGSAWVRRAAIFVVLAAVPLAAADGLFSEPLHLVRRIEDPLSRSVTQVEEFCIGNRIISVTQSGTVIADYGSRQLIEISSSGTYSVTAFGELAAAREALPRSSGRLARQTTSALATIRAAGMKASLSGRPAEWFEVVGPGAASSRVEVAVDQQITVSREALDALDGGALAGDASADAIALACRRPSARAIAAADEKYGLPLEQVIELDDDDGKHLTVRNSVVRVDHDLPPADVLAIPPGARLVPSRRVLLSRSLNELDTGKVLPNRP